MKARSGFVSNSSSSSFIVAFDKAPGDAAELRRMMFDDGTKAVTFVGTLSAETVAETVLKEMKDGPVSLEDIAVFLSDGTRPGTEKDEYWRLPSKAMLREARERLKADIGADFEKKLLFYFSYSDNDGDFWSTMEHGGIFERLPHVYVDEH